MYNCKTTTFGPDLASWLEAFVVVVAVADADVVIVIVVVTVAVSLACFGELYRNFVVCKLGRDLA